MAESSYKKALNFQKLLPSQRKKLFSPGTQIALTRICSFLPDMVDQLEEAEAPFHIYRWISFGKTLAQRIVRLALALHFRRPVDPRNPGPSATDHNWLKDAKQNIAEKLFYETPQGSTLRDWIGKHLFLLRGNGGSMDPDFWREIQNRVHTIDRLTFLMQVDQRVLLKPLRVVTVHNGKRRRAGRVMSPRFMQKLAKARAALQELEDEAHAADPQELAAAAAAVQSTTKTQGEK